MNKNLMKESIQKIRYTWVKDNSTAVLHITDSCLVSHGVVAVCETDIVGRVMKLSKQIKCEEVKGIKEQSLD